MTKLTIKTGSAETFFKRGRRLEKPADREEALTKKSTLTSEDPIDLIKAQPTTDNARDQLANPQQFV